ncbi:MAG: patatin-like phospholipase family protein [Chloroflexi bacterium]|nr:MAG: patatin-like phospholipase family protein [Chloroflexota bacterium]
MSASPAVRSGLVLGAGGVLGGAWMAGALHALAERTRWYPRHAEYIVGTSAGSVLAAFGAAGVPPWLLIPEASTNVYHGLIDAGGNLQVHGDLWERIVRRRPLGLPRFLPGSLSLFLAGMRQGNTTLLKMLCGLAPVGVFSTDPIKDTVRWVANDGGWVQHPNTWIVACDYQTGDRVVFGKEGAPEVDVAQAVAASCAIPGYYRPEEIDGRLYVDGALHSMSNLDLLLGLKLDLVVVVSPHSTRQKFRGWDPLNRFTDVTRQVAARQVDAEVEALRAEGTEVLLLEPVAEDLAAIGGNVMDDRRRTQVMRTATRTTLEQLKRADRKAPLALLERPLQVRPPKPAPEPAEPHGTPQLRPAV